jgi:hypothetical protein
VCVLINQYSTGLFVSHYFVGRKIQLHETIKTVLQFKPNANAKKHHFTKCHGTKMPSKANPNLKILNKKILKNYSNINLTQMTN